MNVKSKIRKMTREILELAEREGLCDATLLERLTIRMANRKGRSNGGKYRGRPWMSIALRSVGWRYSTNRAAEYLTHWEKARPSRRRTREMGRWYRAAAGEGVWGEYPSIANDPEIGDIYGDLDDTDLPLAALLTHELAHVIDYNAGELNIDGRKFGPYGSVHGGKWRAIYRVLRNGYVASGAYKSLPVVLTFNKPTKRAADSRLLGLPLFDVAA